MPRVSSRNGKQLPNYNEAQMDFDLSESDEEYDAYAPVAEDKGASARGLLANRPRECPADLFSPTPRTQASSTRSTACTTTSATASTVRPQRFIALIFDC